MWKKVLTLVLLFWPFVSAANSTKFVPEDEQSYSEEYLDDKYSSEEDKRPGMPIGQWWKNGRALEPKWRDGDNIPSVPFHAITSNNKPHSKERIEVDVEDVSTFQANNENSKNLYTSNVNGNDFANSELRLSRRRKPPQLPEEEAEELKFRGQLDSRHGEKELRHSYEKMPQSLRNANTKNEQKSIHRITEVKFPYENPEAAIKYKETFQNQPNEYELNDEEYQKPRPRKRRPPQNDEFMEARVNYPVYQTLKPAINPEPKTKSAGNNELKTLLKKQQGKDLSLSEILQRSNLTLSDLLQGRANVIDLLQTINKDDSIEEKESRIQEPIRIVNNQRKETKMEMKHKENEAKMQEPVRIIMTKEKDMKIQEPVKMNFGKEKEVKIQEPVRIINSKIMMSQKMTISENPVRVSTTMKNVDATLPEVMEIWKTTVPKKLRNAEEDEIMEFSDFTVKSSTEISEDTEPTLSIEQMWNPEKDETTTEFNVTEMSTQPEEMEEEPKPNVKNHKNESSYEDLTAKIEPDARAEILELFSSGSSAKRLELLLKSRNMTLDELIALRQRGSSQVHLAEVSKYRRQKSYAIDTTAKTDPYTWKPTSKSPGKTTLITIATTTATTTTLSPEKPKDNVADEQRLSFHESKIPYSRIIPPSEKAREILDIYTAFDTIPFTKNINDHYNKIRDGMNFPMVKNGTMTFIEVGRVEEILDEDSGSFNNVYKMDETIDEAETKPYSKMTPSIIASGAILGVTMVVFLAIFIVCRVQQKQKYTYRNTFSRAVFQSPALAARKLSNSSSLNTIMVNVVATSNTKKPDRTRDLDSDYDLKSDIENDSLDGNDSWDTIPDFMK